MNRNFHRIVFNAARGLRMVVQETARSTGRGTRKATGSGTGAGAAGAALGVAATLAALAGSAPLHAQIHADPNAPGRQRATVLLAPNGVPLVNIQTPSAAGVSRNVYRQFDIDANGVILNNSRTNVQTQLGGVVQGNPWLARGPARVIVNEINSNDPTYLRGFVEVAGSRADVIVANPSGISINGGGFINAYRATLTTGVPQYGASGSLEGYLVRGGTVAIGGAGLDASTTDSLAILTRAFALSASLHAADLKVVAGANRIDADLGAIVPIADTGAAPAYAIDVAYLGGMYAGHIALVVNEAGVGARNAGAIQTAAGGYTLTGAGAGRLTLSASGRLENSGVIQAASDVAIDAAGLANGGTVRSAANLAIATRGDLVNHAEATGGTLEGARVELASAAGDIDNRGGTVRQTSAAALVVAAARLSNTQTGFVGAPPPVVVPPAATGAGAASGGSGAATTPQGGSGGTAGSCGTGDSSGADGGGGAGATPAPTPTVLSPGALTAAGAVLNDGGRIHVGGDVTLRTPVVDNAGGVLRVASMAVSGGATFGNVGGTLHVTNTFAADVATFDNAGGTLRAGTLAIATTGGLDNRGGTLASDGAARLDVGGRLDNARGTVSAVDALDVTVAGAVDNTSGRLLANAAVSVTASALDNTLGAVQSAGGATRLTVADALLNDRGRIGAGTDLSIQAGSLANTGAMRAERDATLAVTHGLANDGSIVAGRDTTVAAGRLDGGATGALTSAGTLIAAGHIAAQGAGIDLTGGKASGANIALTATTDDVTTRRATVTTPGTLRVRANASSDRSLVNDAGTLEAGQLDLQVANVRNTNAGRIVQTGGGATAIAVTGTLDNDGGTIASNGSDVTLSAATFVNTAGTVQHAGTGTLEIGATRAFSGAKGRIASNGAIDAHGGDFDLDGGTTSAARVTLDAARLSNQAGVIVQTGTGVTRIATAGDLVNDGGTLATNATEVELTAGGTLSNREGHLRHAGDRTLKVAAGGYDGAKGELVGNGALLARVTGGFSQDGGTTSARQVTIEAGSLSNRAGEIVQTGAGATRVAVTGTLDNTRGTIASNGVDVALAASRLLNTNGAVQHAGSGRLAIDASTVSGANGTIVGDGDLIIQAVTFNQDGGSTSARHIDIAAVDISNAGGTIVQSGTGATHIVASGALNNDRGTIATNGADLRLETGGKLSNANGHVQHAGTGTLAITAGNYDGAGGEVVGNSALVARVSGAFNQDAGHISARQITIDAALISNRGGQIVQTDSGTLHAHVAGMLDNDAGLIGTTSGSKGAVDLKFQTLANQGGRISSDGDLSVESTGDLRNDAGVIRAVGNLAVTASGTATNAQGTIEAAGTASSLSLQAAQIDNTGGQVANGGIGDTTLTAGTVVNAVAGANGVGGLIAGNGGVVVRATNLNNLSNGVLTSGWAMVLGVTDTVTNRGTIASNGALTFDEAHATLDNTAGGAVTAAGDLHIAVDGVSNDGGRIATTNGSDGDLTVIANMLSNHGGTIASDRDLRIVLSGSHVNDGALHAGRHLALSLGGDLTNTATGTLEAVGTLHAEVAGQITNVQGGVVQAGKVDLHVGGALNNNGEITGNTVDVGADSIVNTGNGAITGGDVTLGARTITNQGARALIAATGDVSLWVGDSLNNLDGATIYGGRDIRIAAGSALNANGDLANPSAQVVNRAATIEAQRNIDIAAKTLLNERPGVAIEQMKSLDETHTLYMPTWWHNDDTNKSWYNPAAGNYIPFEIYYVNPADILESSTVVTPDGYQVTRVVMKTHANDTAFFSASGGRDSAYGHRERITMTDGTKVLYALGRQDRAANPDQVAGITSGVWEGESHVVTWDAPAPDFDASYGNCTTDCVRLYAEPAYTDPNSIMIRSTQVMRGPYTSLSELTRTAHTTAVDDRLASGAGDMGRIVAGGDLRIGSFGSVTNRYGEIMAGGQLKLQGAAGSTVDNVATTLYRRYAFDGIRHYADGVELTYTQPEISMAIGSVSGVLSGAKGASITGGVIRNVDLSAGSTANIVDKVQLTSGGMPGSTGPVGNATGSATSTVNGITANAVDGMTAAAASDRGATAVSGAKPITGLGGADALVTVSKADGGGISQGGLFTVRPASTSRYLLETRSAFTNYREWASSDYFFNTLGLDPAHIQKRLGDGFYEQKLIREQVAELTGRRYLSGHADDDSQFLALMTAGVTFAQQYGLRPGITLTPEQMKALTSDIVWMETQTVRLADGSTQEVLVPKVYLAQVGAKAVKPNGALITGDDIRIEGTHIVNRGGTIGGEGTRRAVVVASADIVNEGGTLQAGQLGLKAGGSIRNKTLTVSQGFSQNGGGVAATGSHTSVSNVGRIQATDQLQIDAGGDFVDRAGRIASGGTASIKAGGDVRFDAVETASSDQASIGSSSSMGRASSTPQVGTLTTGGDLSVSGDRDVTFTGTQVSAGGNVGLSAGRHLSVEAATSHSTSDQRGDAAGGSFRQTRSETSVQGASVKAGGGLVANAGTREAGDLRVIGSALEAKGNVRLRASQDIVIGTAQASQDRDDDIRRTDPGTFKNTTTLDHHTFGTTTAVGASVEGKNLTLDSGRDAVVTGSSLYAVNALRTDAKRDVRIEADHDTTSSTDFTQVTTTPSGIARALGSPGTAFSLMTLAPEPLSASAMTRKDAKDGVGRTSTQVVGSTLSAGSIDIHSGRDTTVAGSALVADHDVDIDAERDLDLRSAQSTSTATASGSTQGSGNVGTFWRPAVGHASGTTDAQEADTTQVGSQIASLDGNVRLRAGGTYTQTASDVTALGKGADGKAGNVDITARKVVIDEAYDTRASAQQSQAQSQTAGGTASVPLYNMARGTAGTARATGQTGDSRMQALGAATTAYNGYQTYEAAQDPLGYKVGAMLTDSRSQASSTQSSRTAVGSTVLGAGDVNITATGGGTDSNLTATAATISGNNVSLIADNAVTLQSARSTSEDDEWQSGSKYGAGASYSVGAQNGLVIDLAAGGNRGTGSGSDSTNVNTYVTAKNTATIKSGGDTTLDGAVVKGETVKAEVGGDLRIQSEQDTRTARTDQSGGGFDASICYFWCYGTPVVAGGGVSHAGGNGTYASVTKQSGFQAGNGGFDVKVAGHTNLVGGVIASTDKAVDGGKNSFTTGSLSLSDVVNVDTFDASGYSVAAGYNRTSSVGVGSASGGITSVTTSGISGMAGNAQVRTGDGSNALTPSWIANELLRDVNAQVRITSTASGVVVQMTPQIVEQLNALLVGGTSDRMAPNEINRTREEFDRLQNDPRLTPEQKQQLQTLQSVFNGLIGLGQSSASAPGGPDAVVGGAGGENTFVVFPLAGLGAAGVGAGTAAGAGVAGLDGTSGASQGYRDPENGQWVGGSPPLTLPSLPSLEQLAATNPVIGPVYRVYAAMAQAMANASAANLPLPSELLGIKDAQSGARGNRINNGPLDPVNGGTGSARDDFDHLTGGNSHPAPEGSSFPPGSMIGDNGVIFRPESGGTGPRIDIPANGSKPHETMHYPK